MLLENFWLNLFFILLISYLIGSLPSAYIAGKIKAVDMKYRVSKNVGSMNTFPSVGKFAVVLVTIADFSKEPLQHSLAPGSPAMNLFHCWL